MRVALENKTFVGLGLEGCTDVGDDLERDGMLGLVVRGDRGRGKKKKNKRKMIIKNDKKKKKKTYIISPILRNLIQRRSIIGIIHFPTRNL